MLLQKVAMVRGGGPSKPAAAPVLPFDPDGPIIKNLKQGHHQMNIQPQFPPHRRSNDPQRNSEAMVYDQLARSGNGSQALDELTDVPEAPELDFCAWLEDRARFGLQAKGGR